MTRRLIVLRHAQADALVGGPDHARTLTASGRDQARAAGARIAAAGLRPEHVLCSTAARTRQTLELAVRAFDPPPAVEYDDALYSADVHTVLDLVSRTDPAVGTLLVVGHNPTMAQLAGAFMADDPLTGFPPAATAVIDLEVEWLYAAPGTGTARLLA
ncbi:SixA phosphatase family protein [Streptomonospora nanhaiensis]|uniref:Phosphohistidine phosphatase n=1 Tax=Streptomonospora nanhaiensis TaxID=1323731 RepID=A0A853BQV9_9ACTN|nr:histidine phosphatase family protein [Streptomonospora nanhaiensis]MBV2366799.1 histidine phosphatase family protein [Streptomonospora nanhaiensis]MBX9387701.1 histidine phosphatase family protein [Streptomonospora nanhaiensis]NYI96871.1 phosphohistidine phosphatase [Streptomonospora nanhaiensis]